MTEAEWLASTDPFLMLEHLKSVREQTELRAIGITDRKLYLYGVECCRLIWNGMWEGCHLGVVAAELYAEGAVGPAALATASRACLGDDDALRAAFRAADWVVGGDSGPVDLNDPLQKSLAEEEAVLAREIFGNPFRPLACDPAWLTTDVLALARGIYDERAFDRMPILADALQDAGCTNDDVLNHCRAEAVHVRGCWVVDLLLGKS
jgi:hypothetical protein